MYVYHIERDRKRRKIEKRASYRIQSVSILFLWFFMILIFSRWASCMRPATVLIFDPFFRSFSLFSVPNSRRRALFALRIY